MTTKELLPIGEGRYATFSGYKNFPIYSRFSERGFFDGNHYMFKIKFMTDELTKTFIECFDDSLKADDLYEIFDDIDRDYKGRPATTWYVAKADEMAKVISVCQDMKMDQNLVVSFIDLIETPLFEDSSFLSETSTFIVRKWAESMGLTSAYTNPLSALTINKFMGHRRSLNGSAPIVFQSVVGKTVEVVCPYCPNTHRHGFGESSNKIVHCSDSDRAESNISKAEYPSTYNVVDPFDICNRNCKVETDKRLEWNYLVEKTLAYVKFNKNGVNQ